MEADRSTSHAGKKNINLLPLKLSVQLASRLTSDELTPARSGTFFHITHTALGSYLIVHFPSLNAE